MSVVTQSFDTLCCLFIKGLLDHTLNVSNYVATNDVWWLVNIEFEADTLEVLPRSLDERTEEQSLLPFYSP
jgi:hypothetical protein